MTDSEKTGLREGDKLGRYLLERLLVRSRATRVFLAAYEDAEGEPRRCVVRSVTPSAVDPDFVDAFMRDARVAVDLVHPNLCRVIDVGLVEGTCYLAMELILGVDLLTALGQSRKSGSPFPVDVVLWIAHELCEGLRHVHEQTASDGSRRALVHRNVALPNVMVTDWGVVHLIDFGVSGAEGLRASGGSRDFLGRTDYASPEHLAGAPIDARSDIFSLGVIMHELLTGHRLLHKDGQKIDRAAAGVALEPDPPSKIRRDLPPQVDAVVMQALEHAPENRYGSAAELQRALRAQLLGEPSEGRERLAAFVKERFAANLLELDDEARPPAPVSRAAPVEKTPPVETAPAAIAAETRPPRREPSERAGKSSIRMATMTMWVAGLFTLALAAGAGFFLWKDSQGTPWWTIEAWQESSSGKMARPEPINRPPGFGTAVEAENRGAREPDEPTARRPGEATARRPGEARSGESQPRTREPRVAKATGQKSPTQEAEPRPAASGPSMEGDLLVVCSSRCAIYVDGELQSPAEPGGPLSVAAGERALRVVDVATGREVRRRVLVAPGRVRVEEVEFTPTFGERTGTEEW